MDLSDVRICWMYETIKANLAKAGWDLTADGFKFIAKKDAQEIKLSCIEELNGFDTAIALEVPKAEAAPELPVLETIGDK